MRTFEASEDEIEEVLQSSEVVSVTRVISDNRAQFEITLTDSTVLVVSAYAGNASFTIYDVVDD